MAKRKSAIPSPELTKNLARFKPVIAAFQAKIRTYQEWHRQQVADVSSPAVIAAHTAYVAAETGFAALVEHWLAKGQFDHTLWEAGARNQLPQALMAALHDHISQRAEGQVVEGPAGWEEVVLLGWPLVVVNPASAPLAQEVWLDPLRQALRTAVDQPDLELVPFEQPIHPLAWAELSLDHRVRFFEEQRSGEPGPGTQALLDRQSRLLQASPSDRDIQSMTMIWPLLARFPRPDLDQSKPHMVLGDRLRSSMTAGVWRQVRAEVHELAGYEMMVETPLPIDEAIAYSALLHVRSRQAQADREAGQNPEAQKAIMLTQIEQKGTALRLSFARNGHALPPRLIPLRWLGVSYQGREHMLSQLGLAWGRPES